MKRLLTTLFGCMGALVASLLLALIHPFGDVELHAAGEPGLALRDAPAKVNTLLEAKCADCHSLAPHLPVYAHLAPASWLVERDIVRGREHLNLSRWEQYAPEQQETLKAQMVAETRSGSMPPLQYRLIHRNAALTDGEERALVAWARADSGPASGAASGSISGSSSGPVSNPKSGAASAHNFGAASGAVMEQAAGEGDAAQGKVVFEKRCTGCHTLDADREGPRLRGVYGRAAGAVAGYDYSAALRNSHLVWDEATLEKWLADPDTLVPGNNMEFHMAKADERRDLIRYLRDAAK